MSTINDTLALLNEEQLMGKAEFISRSYKSNHAKLFEYAARLRDTEISSIAITDDQVIMTTRRNGIKMIVPCGDHRSVPLEMLNFGDYERDELAMVMRLTADHQTILDVGANIGWHSLNFAKLYPACRVCAFEPIPRTYEVLRQNMLLNAAANVEAYNMGFSNKSETLEFYFYPEGSGNASSVNLSGRDDVERIRCVVSRLDDFVSQHRLKVDFIKCDVEGAELFVLQGALETVGRDRPIIFAEMLRKWAAKFSYHPNEIVQLLGAAGYRCFSVAGSRLRELLHMTESTVETNFFFLHKEKHAEHINALCDVPGKQ